MANGTKYQVVDLQTGDIHGTYVTRGAATHKAYRLDNAYGAVRYKVQTLTQSPALLSDLQQASDARLMYNALVEVMPDFQEPCYRAGTIQAIAAYGALQAQLDAAVKQERSEWIAAGQYDGNNLASLTDLVTRTMGKFQA
jgi:hypothetical protein